jgi:hypothetical protein
MFTLDQSTSALSGLDFSPSILRVVWLPNPMLEILGKWKNDLGMIDSEQIVFGFECQADKRFKTLQTAQTVQAMQTMQPHPERRKSSSLASLSFFFTILSNGTLRNCPQVPT